MNDEEWDKKWEKHQEYIDRALAGFERLTSKESLIEELEIRLKFLKKKGTSALKPYEKKTKDGKWKPIPPFY